jgi:uncharacterized protein (DUF1330 family)
MTVSLCVLLWARPGLAEELSAYEDRVLALMGDHGGEVLHRARTQGADTELTEIQFIRFASEAGVESYLADPRRIELADERERVIARTETLPVSF